MTKGDNVIKRREFLGVKLSKKNESNGLSNEMRDG
jgi:hypothetical protein